MDNFIQDLENFLIEEEAKELQIQIEDKAPIIGSDNKANFFIKLCSNLQNEINEINEMSSNEIAKVTARVESFRDNAVKPLANQLAFYQGLLKNYTENKLIDSKKKNLKLPNGMLQFKKQQPTWEYKDVDALIAFMEENNSELVIVEENKKVDKVSLKKTAVLDLENGVATINNKVIPGIHLYKNEDAFHLKYNE